VFSSAGWRGLSVPPDAAAYDELLQARAGDEEGEMGRAQDFPASCS